MVFDNYYMLVEEDGYCFRVFGKNNNYKVCDACKRSDGRLEIYNDSKYNCKSNNSSD
jgi:hypothetical protein